MKTILLIMVWSATLLVACVTAIANYHYGLLVGAGQERYVYAVGGTVLDVVKTFLPTLMGTFLIGRLSPGMFFRHVAGWTFWCVGVAWSMACALGLYAIVKETKVGDMAGQRALYQQLKDTKAGKERDLAALSGRSIETVEGEIAVLKRDKLYSRSKECTDATATESRQLCASIDKLTAERLNVRPANVVMGERAKLQRELSEVTQRLSSIDLGEVFRKADPAGDALAKLLSWDTETVKTRLAFMIALLFEFTSLLPWIVTGSHTARRNDPPEKQAPKAAAEHKAPPEIDLPEVASIAAEWAKGALTRRKGSFVPAGELAENFETWCRANGHEQISKTAFGKQMTQLGFDRRKQSGQQRYVDVALIPKVRAELRVVA